MINLSIASGKGGTGKTTVAVNLALSVNEKNIQLLDCDVEEPNGHLFLKPVIESTEEIGIPVPTVELDKCSFCGRCAEVCSFNALAVFAEQVMILAELCHGCGSCAYFCPEKAISEIMRPIGILEKGRAGNIEFAHGRLYPGEAMSPPLIGAVKNQISSDLITIIDAPPGTSCPVVSAVKGSDFCLLVAEPTPFGLHDLDLVCQMTARLGIPAGVVINRCDLGDSRVEDYCRDHDLPVLQKIPFDLEIARLYARGEPAVLHLPNWYKIFQELFAKVLQAHKEAVAR